MLLRSISAATLAAVAVAPSLAQSQLAHPRSVEDVLPASTYAAMRFGGLEACRQAASDLPLSKLVEAFLGEVPPELRERFLDDGLDDAADELRQHLQEAGIKPADVRAVMGRPMALALGRLSIEGMGPSVCLLIDEGNEREAINRTAQAVSRMLPRLGAEVSVERTEIAGHRFYHLQIHEAPPIFAGSIAGHYVVTNSRGYAAEVAAVAAGKQQGLMASTRIGGLRQQLPAPALVSLAVNATTVMDALQPHLPYEAEDLSAAVGLGRLDVVYGAMTAGERGGTDLLHFGIGGSESGLAKALVAAPADLSFARACSENTIVFGAGSFDVPAVIDAFHRFVELLPAEARNEMMREISREFSREFRHAGTSPAEVDAILRAFGNQIGYAIALEKGAMPKPELLVRVAVKDADPIVSLMQRFEALSHREGGLEWKTRKSDDHEIRFCNVPIEDQFQLSPCYVLTDDALWIGSDVAGLVRSLRRLDKPEDSLAAEEDFERLSREAAGASGVLHVRSFRGVEIGWRTVETMLYPMLDAQADELGFDSEALPDSETLAAALGTTTFVYRVDDDGVTVKSEGTLAFGALIAAMGAMGDVLLDRASAKVF